MHCLILPGQVVPSNGSTVHHCLHGTGFVEFCLVLHVLSWCDILHDMLQLIALHDVTSTDAAIVYTLEPVLGATLAYLLLGERWGPAGRQLLPVAAKHTSI